MRILSRPLKYRERDVTDGIISMDAYLEVAAFESFDGELHIGEFRQINLKNVKLLRYIQTLEAHYGSREGEREWEREIGRTKKCAARKS